MDFPLMRMRDRRIAASDEVLSVQRSAETGRFGSIYGVGSAARTGGAGRARRTDRSPEQINTIVLHQTAGAFISGLSVPMRDAEMSDNHRVDRIAAHFIIAIDGTIFYLHDVEFIMANAGGRYGIDIELCGTYAHTPEPTGQRLSDAAIRAGRHLVRCLTTDIPTIRHIHPHGQIGRSPARRGDRPGPKFDSCSGPDIWINVGMWAVHALRLVADRPYQTYPNFGISPRQANEAYRHPTLTVGPTYRSSVPNGDGWI